MCDLGDERAGASTTQHGKSFKTNKLCFWMCVVEEGRTGQVLPGIAHKIKDYWMVELGTNFPPNYFCYFIFFRMVSES